MLMGGLMVVLKTFLSLAMPHQYHLDVTKQMLSLFLKSLTFMIPTYSSTVLYDTISTIYLLLIFMI